MTKKQFEEITKWQKETFTGATAASKLIHLGGKDLGDEERGEIGELYRAIFHEHGKEEIRHEFADCFFLLFGAAAAHGMTYEDICNAINEKFIINKKREWEKPDENGVVNHVK